MQVILEFYRTRSADAARAVVGRERAIVGDLASAISIARLWSTALKMPQRPDGVAIRDEAGTELYCAELPLPELDR